MFEHGRGEDRVIELLILLYRTAILWIVALVVFRMMGKRTLAKLGPFDFAVIIMIGEAVAIGMEDSKTPLMNAIGITVLLGALQYLLTWLNVRYRWLEKITQGTSTLIVEQGHVKQQQMKRERVSNPDLDMELRKNDVSLDEVVEARLEPTGDISLKKKKSELSNNKNSDNS
ncbi:MAG: hypothetical protein C7B43_03300 [Sulfobacillus benefaciens]|uniref:YetF C-terminal domain-containing protein n=1 Tax=Sulfobacillus benefaciens TaxID=453960 RepID=A0A2T2X9L3_9FIRM|nr:MAG: hypothetical protein C7B43_03300 [Sulfobacillus benefaciens]HBQ95268.1 hypothetical protein [Sulfobacillus sp.]